MNSSPLAQPMVSSGRIEARSRWAAWTSRRSPAS
jgi:hypothetical protein